MNIFLASCLMVWFFGFMAEARAKKPKHAKNVAAGQAVLVGLEETMGYDICLLADPRHEVFCREYAVHANASKAYAKAFPSSSVNACRANACRLIAHDNIKRRVAEIQLERLDRLEVTHKKIIFELAKMAFVDERDFYRADGTIKNIPDMDPDIVSSVESLKVRVVSTNTEDGVTQTVTVSEIKHGNKREALKLLMSQRGMLKEGLVLGGEIGLNHSGAVGLAEDLEKLAAMRERFKGMGHGATDSSS